MSSKKLANYYVTEDYQYNTVDHSSLIKSNLPPKWLIALLMTGLGVIGISASVIVGMQLSIPMNATTTAMPITTTRSDVKYIGQSCQISTDCIPSAHCDATTKLCACSPQLYYDTITGICSTRKTYGSTCSSSLECEYNNFLMCLNGYCICDVFMYWNTKTFKCEDKRGLGESCQGIKNECYSSTMSCTTLSSASSGSSSTRCLCPVETHYFSFYTGNCELKKPYAAQCNAHFECMDYGWCTNFPSDPSSQSRCQCNFLDFYKKNRKNFFK